MVLQIPYRLTDLLRLRLGLQPLLLPLALLRLELHPFSWTDLVGCKLFILLVLGPKVASNLNWYECTSYYEESL
jgi:hypothetical protein